jgi:hypothetical protein
MIWPIFFFSKVASSLSKHVKWLAVVTAFITWILGLIEWAVKTVCMQISNALASINVDAFQNVALASLDWISYANAVVPISEFATLFGLFCTAWLTVILVRWVKSFIPTIGN